MLLAFLGAPCVFSGGNIPVLCGFLSEHSRRVESKYLLGELSEWIFLARYRVAEPQL
jgi:hypothetical protein